MSSRVGRGIVLVALMLTVAACGSNAPAKRVFFVAPTNGATIKPEAKIEFGTEGFTIAAVPEGEVKDVRPETGHFHLAVDTDCLPPGQEIPKADPWVHFGKAQTSVETSLTPGPHKLTLQAGDDLHRTMEGLCETINVTVAP
jgi:hypothetical protein